MPAATTLFDEEILIAIKQEDKVLKYLFDM